MSARAFSEAAAFLPSSVLPSRNAFKLSAVYLALSKCHRKGILQGT